VQAQPQTPSDALPPAEPRAALNQQLANLLSQICGGCAASFEAFYNLSVVCIAPRVRRLVGDNYCEDVLADTYFQAWRDAKNFDPGRGTALAWLLTMARSRALDKLRAENLRHGGLSGAPEAQPDEQADLSLPGPCEQLESMQTSAALHRALTVLSPHERWVLGLAYFRELSQSEIADVTGLPLGTVKSLVSRSQHKLRQFLAPKSPRTATR
jgi:RNA polymerase sigma-70 factor, ECF subfamily